MSKIKNAGLDQYGAEPLEQQQFGTAGVEWVKPDATRDECSMHTTMCMLHTTVKCALHESLVGLRF